VGVFKECQGSWFIMRLLIVKLIAGWDGCLHLYFRRCHHLTEPCSGEPIMLEGVIVLEIVCIVSGIAGALGIKAFGRWVSGAMQYLVWVK